MKFLLFYWGSPRGQDRVYAEAAPLLGQLLAEAGWGLVYGGGRVGLMGAVADAAMAHHANVLGIIPEFLHGLEVAHEGISELQVVPDMHERKARMAEKADAFLVLPGGFGTLEELYEILTWAQLQLHHKPVVLANINGYYEHLIRFMDQQVEAGFLKANNRSLIPHFDSVQAAFKHLQQHISTQHTGLDQEKI